MAGALDFAGQTALLLGVQASFLARENTASRGQELTQQFSVFVVNVLKLDVFLLLA